MIVYDSIKPILVPNFTEERVKRFARILESNESLIDDLASIRLLGDTPY